MASAGKSQLLSFMDELIPTIRTALCDRFVSIFFSASVCSLCLIVQETVLQLFPTVFLRFVSQLA